MTFQEILTAAVADISEKGFSADRVAYWQQRLREAAAKTMRSQARMQDMLDRAMRDIYRKLIENRGILKFHPGVSRFTLEQVKPKLRAELQKRIYASADLIKLNREEAMSKTLRRFSGWASSVPEGGSDIVAKQAVKADVKKALQQLPFEERRVLIDQGHKFAASLSDIVAKDGGAIAAVWRHHHVTYPRKEHLNRDGVIFLIRGSWAQEQGLVKPAGRQYTDEIEQPAEFVFCRCSYQYLYNISDLPPDMLTEKGRDLLAKVRAEIRAMMAA